MMVEKVDVVDENQAEEEKVVEVKTFPKRIQCPRCKGDCLWHSSKTGVRARTSSDHEFKPDVFCPKCKGKGKGIVVIRISEEQAKKESAERKAAKGKIEHDKRVAKARIDAEAKEKKKALESIT